jgi:hypothetical protein
MLLYSLVSPGFPVSATTRSPNLADSDLSTLTRAHMRVCELEKLKRFINGKVKDFKMVLADTSNPSLN